jgi:hypothetical protein
MDNAIQMINNCPCCKALPSDITITAKNIDGRFCCLVSCDKCGHKVFGHTLMKTADKWNEVKA